MANDESFRKTHIESCRRGGKQSGQTRLKQGKRLSVEYTIRSRLAAQVYDHNTAGKLAVYFNVSARFVRRLAKQIKAEPK